MTHDTLQVKMLGRFTAVYRGQTLKMDFSSTTKMMQLLALLLLYHDGISREKLLFSLYGNSEVANSKNNLRVTISRLRKAFHDAGLSPEVNITANSGIYCLEGDLEIESDVALFENCVTQAAASSDPDASYQLLEKACGMYTGEFLPDFSMEEWVMVEQVRLKKAYITCFQELLEMFKQRREYDKMFQFSMAAAKMYPYDEWQAYQIDALIAMNRYDEAMKLYDKTVSLYFDDLGIPLSENMLQRLRAMSDSIHYELTSVSDILAGLNEDEEKRGAYYCNFPSFIDNFRMLQRLSERDGRSCYLVVCTLVGKDKKPLDDQKFLHTSGSDLKLAFEKSLRRGDIYTKYSTSQYLLLLVGIKQEDAAIVTNRIDGNLARLLDGKKINIRYRLQAVSGCCPPEHGEWKF